MDTPQNAESGTQMGNRIAIISLLTGATVWGIIWYPYRLLEAQGIGGIEASIITYLISFLVALGLWYKKLRREHFTPMLALVGLFAACSNIGYVLGSLLGEVTRVLLLFYLAPLWTLLFARLILGDKINVAGLAVIALSLSGAMVMLWHPESGLPWPSGAGEWIGLGAGITFSLGNVLIRKSTDLPLETKSLAVFFGVVVIGLVLLPFFPSRMVALPQAGSLITLVIIGLTLLFTNFVVQYGITKLPAAQSVVILLFELVVASVAAWLLAGEEMTLREWLGGGLIVSASLLSVKLEGQVGH